MENMYLISEKELKELLLHSLYYEALDSGGVDNWEWYSDSISYLMDSARQQENYKDILEMQDIVDIDIKTFEKFEVKIDKTNVLKDELLSAT